MTLTGVGKYIDPNKTQIGPVGKQRTLQEIYTDEDGVQEPVPDYLPTYSPRDRVTHSLAQLGQSDTEEGRKKAKGLLSKLIQHIISH